MTSLLLRRPQLLRLKYMFPNSPICDHGCEESSVGSRSAAAVGSRVLVVSQAHGRRTRHIGIAYTPGEVFERIRDRSRNVNWPRLNRAEANSYAPNATWRSAYSTRDVS